jgi:hypothetical protein
MQSDSTTDLGNFMPLFLCSYITTCLYTRAYFCTFLHFLYCQGINKNFMTLVRERTIPTERPPLVGEVSANFCGERVSRGQRDGSLQPYSRISRPELLSCIHEAEWTPFYTQYFSENLVAPGIEPGPLDL